MPSHPFTSAPRSIMFLSNLIYSIGAYIADWSETHVLNPRWPPHARFHNGQTMSLGALLTSVVFFVLSSASSSQPKKQTTETQKLLVLIAALVGSLYTTAGLSAIFYPGADWADPEHYVPYAPQAWIFGGQLVINWLAYQAEVARIEREGGVVKKAK